MDIRDENGNTVIEATFIVTTVLFVMFLIIMLGLVRYQNALIQSVANETAQDIAKTYSYCQYTYTGSNMGVKGKDPITGYIGRDNLSDQGIIGASYWLMTFGEHTQSIPGNIGGGLGAGQGSLKPKEGLVLAQKLSDGRRLMAAQNYSYTVSVKHSELALFQNEVEVTLTEEYDIPFARLLGVNDGIVKKTYKGKAICYDIVGARSYYNTIEKTVKVFSDQSVTKILKNIVGTIKNVKGGASSAGSFWNNIVNGNK